MLVSISAMVFTILIFIVVLFQLALALGMPWGSYAMGGKFPGKYPPGMRVGAIVQAIVLLVIASIVLSKSGFFFRHGVRLPTKRSGLWLLFQRFQPC